MYSFIIASHMNKRTQCHHTLTRTHLSEILLLKPVLRPETGMDLYAHVTHHIVHMQNCTQYRSTFRNIHLRPKTDMNMHPSSSHAQVCKILQHALKCACMTRTFIACTRTHAHVHAHVLMKHRHIFKAHPRTWACTHTQHTNHHKTRSFDFDPKKVMRLCLT